MDYLLVVTGIHLLKKYGYSINEIKAEKFKIYKKFKIYDSKFNKEDDGAGMSRALGQAVIKLSDILKKTKPDLILSGFDIAANFAATVAGAHMNIPVAHIQGGEVSGNIDESLRHATSKFSHFHFTANLETKKRLIKMGEISKNIYAVGCPSIDALMQEKDTSKKTIIKKFGINVEKKFLLIIQHPVTSELNYVQKQIRETVSAISKFKLSSIFVFPNNDAGSSKIIKIIEKKKLNCARTLNLSEYKTLLKNCSVLIGNSSSGIHEALSFFKPVINIGTRQQGRFKPKNIINVGYNSKQIFKTIVKCINDLNFLNKVKKLKNPYGDGKSSEKIIKIIKKLKLDQSVIQKQITY